MNVSRNRGVAVGWVLLGAALVVLSAIVSNAALEQVVGKSTGSLAWGPALFRVLLAVHGAALMLVGSLNRRKKGSTGTDTGSGAESGSASAGPERRIGAVSWFVLGALTLIAFGLRLWHLNSC